MNVILKNNHFERINPNIKLTIATPITTGS